MRINGILFGFLGMGLAFGACAIASQAQGPRPFEGGGRGGWQNHVITGKPYSGVRTSTYTQTLANGTVIQHTSTTTEARDSSGRFYRATTTTGENGGSRTEYSVVDPVNRVTTSWRSDGKQAFVVHMPNFNGRPGWQPGSQPDEHGGPGGMARHQGPTPTVTQLGSKAFGSVNANGTRSSITFPVGSFGNSEAITVTHERWSSDDLHLTVSETDNDPRDGVHTTNLTNINLNDPDPTLFQVPQGYTVVDRKQGRGFQGN